MTTACQDPTDSSGTGSNLPNAYTSNDAYAILSGFGTLGIFKKYGFDAVLPSNINIQKVEIGLEMYFSRPCTQESIKIAISVNNGDDWSEWSDNFCLQAEGTMWINVTAYKETWLRDYLLDANWLVKAQFETVGGAGCPDKEAWSCYLDWIPTLLTYEEIEDIAKAHSGALLNPGIF